MYKANEWENPQTPWFCSFKIKAWMQQLSWQSFGERIPMKNTSKWWVNLFMRHVSMTSTSTVATAPSGHGLLWSSSLSSVMHSTLHWQMVCLGENIRSCSLCWLWSWALWIHGMNNRWCPTVLLSWAPPHICRKLFITAQSCSECHPQAWWRNNFYSP